MPRGGELLDRVREVYESWYRIWSQTYIPKLLFRPKWWSEESDLNEGDIVLFRKKESVLEHEWTYGRIDQLILGRDGKARRAIVQYQNINEDFKRTTDRSVRCLVKLFSLDDHSIEEDLELLHKKLMVNVVQFPKLFEGLDTSIRMKKFDGLLRMPTVLCCSYGSGLNSCCCKAHCSLGFCPDVKIQLGLEDLVTRRPVVGFCHYYSSSLYSLEDDVMEQYGMDGTTLLQDCDCSLSSLLCNLELNLD